MQVATRSALLVALSCLASRRAAVAQDVFTGVGRIVAVGDIHGDYEQFVTVLRQAGVIDAKARWAGGRTHLVQVGDVLDRGPDSRKAMELLMALEPQAEKARGQVHALIGNHEAMNMAGDLRYVSAGEYAAFAGPTARQLQQRAFVVLSDSTQRADSKYRTEWFAAHPLGWVEQRLAFEGNGRYATWIRRHNAVVRINDYLFLHGGISPAYVDSTIASLNAGVRQALRADSMPRRGTIADDEVGPLWYRGLALGDERELSAHVDSVLAHFGVAHVVIGHTVTAGTVIPRFGGRVIMIDVGLSAFYGGPPACLIIDGGVAYALHRGKLLALPLGGDVMPYFEAAAALDPVPSRLRVYLDSLKAVKSR